MRRQSLALNESTRGTALDRPLGARVPVTRYVIIVRASGLERVIGVEHTHALAESLASRFNAAHPDWYVYVEPVIIGAPIVRARRVESRNLHESWSAR